MLSEEERRARFDAAWEEGDLLSLGSRFTDLITNRTANDTIAEFIPRARSARSSRTRRRPRRCARRTTPSAPSGCASTAGYYETFNLPHVRLVDLRKQPITTITETGIDTTEESFEFDAIVFATGFDAMTGAIVAVDITGRDGVSLKQKWADGPVTYLGLTTVGFPNLFMVTGPGSPSVLSNMVGVDRAARRLDRRPPGRHARATASTRIEPTPTAEAGWVQHVNDCADITLFPTANSWYMGANVPGKPRVFLPYIGGVDAYRGGVRRGRRARTTSASALDRPGGEQCNDGVIRRLQPDVAMVLEMMAELGLPPHRDAVGRRGPGVHGRR